MSQTEKKKEPAAIKNLSELKRLIRPGTELKALFHKNHPEIVGLTRIVTEVQTNAFYSVIKDHPEHHFSTCNYGKGFRSDFEKAGLYQFDGSTVRVLDPRKNDGSTLYEMEVYPNTNIQTEKQEENMKSYEAQKSFAERMKRNYPVGTRIQLEHMDDPYTHIPPGTRGTVVAVDDIGTLHMAWDNGGSLGIVPGEDSFHKLAPEELEAEKQTETVDEDDSLVQTM